MSIVLCPKCSLSAKCYCRCLGTSILDYAYEYIVVCENCGHTEEVKESGGCWSGPSTKCPFCGKIYKMHQDPPKKLQSL